MYSSARQSLDEPPFTTPAIEAEEASERRSLHAEPSAIGGPSARRLLVVEDDVALARLLGTWLAGREFAVDIAHNGEEALALVADQAPDLVLLDLNLPGMDGIALLHRLRETMPAQRVMVLTGRARAEDMVGALNDGADDFVVKPFSLVELLARIHALLRRSSMAAAETARRPAASLVLRPEDHCVERDGHRIDLTPREFSLLEFLLAHAPHPVSRAVLMEEVWRMPFDPTTNIVDVYMKYLRDKIDAVGTQKVVRTVRGVGYAIVCG